MIQFGRYVLERRLAAGGMAEVLLGHAEGPGGFQKKVVVKRILPDRLEDDHYVRMFLDEARLAARFNHSNLIHVYELVEEGGLYGLVMEYVEGLDLARLIIETLKQSRPIPFAIAAFIVAEAAEGLHYAHELTDERGRRLDVVHRDISPQNIITTWKGEVKVVDFGIAKSEDRRTEATQSGVIKGKYPYMSPEQATGRPLDARSDIFALGSVLYELLAQNRCFKRATPVETLRAVMDGDVRPLELFRPDVPEPLNACLKRMLSREPANRFANAGQLARDLRRFATVAGASGPHDVATFIEDVFSTDTKTVRLSYTAISDSDQIEIEDSEELADVTRVVTGAEIQRTHSAQVAAAPTDSRARSDTAPVEEVSPPATGDETVRVSRNAIRDDPHRARADDTLRVHAADVETGYTDESLVGSDPSMDGITSDPGDTQRARVNLGRPTIPNAIGPIEDVAIARLWGFLSAHAGVLVLLISALIGGALWLGVRADDEAASPSDPVGGLTSPMRLDVPTATTDPDPAPVESPALPAPSLPPRDGATPEEEDPTPSPAAVLVEEEEPSSPGRKSGRPSRASRPTAGRLSVSSTPAVDVYLKGRKLGRSPLENLRIAAGNHTFTLRNSTLGIRKTVRWRVAAGETLTRQVTFGTGRLAVTARPWAEVWVDGKKVGTTPMQPVELYEGEHDVMLVNPELKKRIKIPVSIRSGGLTKIEKSLL